MTPREELARELRLQHEEYLTRRHDGPPLTPWEELPHERRVKWLELAARAEQVIAARRPAQPINVVFDGPPSHESGRFVEVETDDGRSINAGEWSERPDGLWSLRITELPRP